jgi:hypothetical protein
MSHVTPAKLPLLPKRQDSEGSRFTSARSEDLHELQQIFDHAKDRSSKDTSPDKTPRSRFMRPSINSLHSLQKVKSVHALIKRRLSKDLSKTTPTSTPKKSKTAKEKHEDVEVDTVIRVARDGPNLQLKITKSDLKKDLLSDKKPDEGGYDSDAEVLSDVARKISKKSPSKRTSIHSIDWKTSSPSRSVRSHRNTLLPPTNHIQQANTRVCEKLQRFRRRSSRAIPTQALGNGWEDACFFSIHAVQHSQLSIQNTGDQRTEIETVSFGCIGSTSDSVPSVSRFSDATA